MIGSIISRIVSFGLIALFLVGIGFYVGKNYTAPAETPAAITEQTPVQTVSLMLDYGNGTVKTLNDIPWNASSTVFEVLKKLDEEKKIALTYKDYGGELGVFIEAIDGKKGDTKANTWWQYWVNNRYSTMGVSNNMLKAGDIVEFKLTKEQTSTSGM